MAIKYVDSFNVVSDEDSRELHDGLRGEIGLYWELNAAGILDTTDRLKSNKLDDNKTSITSPNVNNTILFPEISQKITIVGHEGEFRDHIQWREFLREKIKLGVNFSDHHFSEKGADGFQYNLYKNSHHPDYEDATKVYESNQLININLSNYENNIHPDTSGFIKNAAGLLTEFDTLPNQVIPDSNSDLIRLYDEYEDRIEQLAGSLSELNVKQRNIFHLDFDTHVGLTTLNETVPYLLHAYYYTTGMPEISEINTFKQTKYLLQSIKRNEAYQNLRFYANETVFPVRVHNMINLILNYDAANFNEERDETYLLEEDDLDSHLIENRFVNQIRKIKTLEALQALITPASPMYGAPTGLRSYERTIFKPYLQETPECNRYILGYKIEKFLDNDATLPVQTYYVKNTNQVSSNSSLILYDTQLKFGREYIYKITKLIMVLGSSYSYSNLTLANENSELETIDGIVIDESGGSLLPIPDKYQAHVDVLIRPSFQIIEVPAVNFKTMFFDECPPAPDVMFYNERGKKNSLKMYFQSNQNELYDRETQFVPLIDSDLDIVRKLDLSADSIYATTFTNKYAIGAFEIYRMDSKPESLEDFAANYLTVVDMRNDWFWNDNRQSYPSYPFDTENLDAFFEDNIIPNKKYYYLFRSLTYHNTPSNPTPIYEVELIQDSDETKLVVSDFNFPNELGYTYDRKAKRIMKITPNFEQLMFNEEDNTIGNPELNKLVLGPEATKKFKVRITSKHTGKKMDINITVRLSDETQPIRN